MFPLETVDIFFYIVSTIIIVTAILTVTAKNVLQSAIFLIFSFIGTAVFYLMLHAEFNAIAQVMIYAGG
jgi:NADH-quinone oxidoreductase subunit J